MRTRRSYCVYLMGSISGTFYIGMTGNLHKRVFDIDSIALRVSPTITTSSVFSIYWRSYDEVHKAIGREKQLKGRRREKKVVLIESTNPRWLD